jgi:hypothetical protein
VAVARGLTRLKRAGRRPLFVQSVPLPTMRSRQLRRVSFTNPFTTRSAARRATVANRNGINGTERNGYAVTTLTEGIS